MSWRWVFVGVAATMVSSSASAHQFAPSLLEVVETEPGSADVRWKQPAVRVLGSELRPVLPGGCQGVGEPEVTKEGTGLVATWKITCPNGLVGQTLGIEGLPQSKVDALLRVALADGRTFRHVLTGDEPRFTIPEQEGKSDVIRGYTVLGVEHILSGWDHLLFVLGLVLLVGWSRKLLWTVTAFTVGHSITLALAVLGFVNVPQAPIEALIAASIYFLAIELIGKQSGKLTMMERMPWIVAGAFGLVQGLGFAGALSEVGLPAHEIPLALLAFNVGIEAGQLIFVFGVVIVWAVLKRIPLKWPSWALRSPAYAIGSVAVFWFIERVVGLMPSQV